MTMPCVPQSHCTDLFGCSSHRGYTSGIPQLTASTGYHVDPYAEQMFTTRKDHRGPLFKSKYHATR